MTSPFSDELISAYLDGELTAQEQVTVEEQLRGNADLRRMCDELRALRATLQAMPAVEPPENFAERILRQAERRMLLDDVSMSESSFVADAQSPSPTGRRHVALRDWRVGVAVVVALAACVLTMLWLPPRAQQARNVALAPETAPAAPAPITAERLSEQLVELRVDGRDGPVGSVRNTAELAPVTADFALQDGTSATRFETDRARRMQSMPLAAPAAAAPAPAAPQPQPPSQPPLENVPGQDVSPDGFGGGAGGMMGGGQAEFPAGGMPGGSGGAGGMLGGGQAGGFPGTGAAGGLAGAANSAISEPMTPEPAISGPMIPGPAGGTGMGLTTEGKAGLSGAGSAMGRLEGFGEEPHAGAPVTARLIDQLVAQLDETQMLLVKVQLPQHALSASLADLGKSIRADQQTDQGAVKALDAYTFQALDEDTLSRALAIKEESMAGPVALEFGKPSGGPSQTVFVVHGSAEQIRQSLGNLIAKPDVALETAPAEFKTYFFRSLGLEVEPTDALEAERQSGGDVASAAVKENVEKDKAQTDPLNLESLLKRSRQPTEPAGARGGAAFAAPMMDSKQSATADERPQSSAKSQPDLADRAGGQAVVPPTREWKDVAENRTSIYILFRLSKE